MYQIVDNSTNKVLKEYEEAFEAMCKIANILAPLQLKGADIKQIKSIDTSLIADFIVTENNQSRHIVIKKV